MACLRGTDAALAARRSNAVLLAFATPDSGAFVVFAVGFGRSHEQAQDRARSLRDTRLARFLSLEEPSAQGGAGDAAVDDFGTRIATRIVERQNLSRDTVEKEARILARRAHDSIDRCLEENRVGAPARPEAPPSAEVAVCLGTIPGAEPIATSAEDVVARLYGSGAVAYAVIVGPARAIEAARTAAGEDLDAAGLESTDAVAWRASRGGLVATGLEPAVDRAAARIAHLDRRELARRAAALRRRVEPRVRACLRR
jgi:hypothetical protein